MKSKPKNRNALARCFNAIVRWYFRNVGYFVGFCAFSLALDGNYIRAAFILSGCLYWAWLLDTSNTEVSQDERSESLRKLTGYLNN